MQRLITPYTPPYARQEDYSMQEQGLSSE